MTGADPHFPSIFVLPHDFAQFRAGRTPAFAFCNLPRSRTMRRGIAPALLLFSLTATVSAQQLAQKKNINRNGLLAMPTYGGYQLSPDGKWVLFTRAERDLKDY